MEYLQLKDIKSSLYVKCHLPEPDVVFIYGCKSCLSSIVVKDDLIHNCFTKVVKSGVLKLINENPVLNTLSLESQDFQSRKGHEEVPLVSLSDDSDFQLAHKRE